MHYLPLWKPGNETMMNTPQVLRLGSVPSETQHITHPLTILPFTASSLIWKLYTLQTTTSPTLHSNCSQPTNFTEIPQINFTFTAIALGTVPSIILIVHRDAMETGDNFFLVH